MTIDPLASLFPLIPDDFREDLSGGPFRVAWYASAGSDLRPVELLSHTTARPQPSEGIRVFFYTGIDPDLRRQLCRQSWPGHVSRNHWIYMTPNGTPRYERPYGDAFLAFHADLIVFTPEVDPPVLFKTRLGYDFKRGIFGPLLEIYHDFFGDQEATYNVEMDFVYSIQSINGVNSIGDFVGCETGLVIKNKQNGDTLDVAGLHSSPREMEYCKILYSFIFRECKREPSLLLQSESIPYPSGYHTPRNIYIFFTTISDEHFRDQLLERGIRITAGCFDSNHVLDQFRGLRMDYPKDLRDPDRVIDVH